MQFEPGGARGDAGRQDDAHEEDDGQPGGQGLPPHPRQAARTPAQHLQNKLINCANIIY